MAVKRAHYVSDYRFLYYKVPEDPNLREKLFINRDVDLDILEEQLDEPLTSGESRILCVTGSSWVGKSHAVWRVLGRLAGRPRLEICTVRCESRINASQVMTSVFEKLRALLVRQWNDSYAGPGPLTAWALQILAEIEPVVTGAADEVRVRSAEQWKRARSELFSSGINLPGFSSGLQLGEANETAGEDSLELTIKKPSPLGLADLAVLVGEVLVREAKLDRILLFADDLDLITHQPGENRELDALLEAMRRLAASSALVVLITGRRYYVTETGDAMMPLYRMPTLEQSELLELYLAHLRAFSDPEAELEAGPFTLELLNRAATDAGGSPGSFLRGLHDLYQAQRKKVRAGGGPLGIDDLGDFHRQAVARFNNDYPDQMRLLKSAIAAGQFVVQPEVNLPGLFRGTELLNRVVRPALTRAGLYEINSSWRPYLMSPARNGHGPDSGP